MKSYFKKMLIYYHCIRLMLNWGFLCPGKRANIFIELRVDPGNKKMPSRKAVMADILLARIKV